MPHIANTRFAFNVETTLDALLKQTQVANVAFMVSGGQADVYRGVIGNRPVVIRLQPVRTVQELAFFVTQMQLLTDPDVRAVMPFMHAAGVLTRDNEWKDVLCHNCLASLSTEGKMRRIMSDGPVVAYQIMTKFQHSLDHLLQNGTPANQLATIFQKVRVLLNRLAHVGICFDLKPENVVVNVYPRIEASLIDLDTVYCFTDTNVPAELYDRALIQRALFRMYVVVHYGGIDPFPGMPPEKMSYAVQAMCAFLESTTSTVNRTAVLNLLNNFYFPRDIMEIRPDEWHAGMTFCDFAKLATPNLMTLRLPRA